MPVQGTGLAGIQQQLCGITVRRAFDLKTSDGQSTQTPNPGDIGFTGYLYDVTAGQSITNTRYVLYYYVNSQNKGCSTNVNNDPFYVGLNVTAGLPYRFTAYFKVMANPAPPPTTHELQLLGTWTQQ